MILVYPHTSNWDFVIGVLFRLRHTVFIHWAGKDTLFHWPMKSLFLRLGGIPINRRQRTGMTAQLTEVLQRESNFHLGITPEGTRAKLIIGNPAFTVWPSPRRCRSALDSSTMAINAWASSAG